MLVVETILSALAVIAILPNVGYIVDAWPVQSPDTNQIPWSVNGDTSKTARGDAVKEAFRHSWNGYKQYAWGYDELLSVSKRGGNSRYVLPFTTVIVIKC
jgi:hypothetical protein